MKTISGDSQHGIVSIEDKDNLRTIKIKGPFVPLLCNWETRQVTMRGGKTANVWLLKPPHWCWDFENPFAIRGRVPAGPHNDAVHQWRLDGHWSNTGEHEYDLILPSPI